MQLLIFPKVPNIEPGHGNTRYIAIEEQLTSLNNVGGHLESR